MYIVLLFLFAEFHSPQSVAAQQVHAGAERGHR